MLSHSFDPDLVRPLAMAENQFLQVLIDRFRICRRADGFELHAAFGDSSPAIWSREAKQHVLNSLPAERRRALQQKIEAFFRSYDAEFRHHDPTFPFRLGNGGTLPIVRLGETDYYCLFYRDSHPTGWNIANGRASSRQDLLHPALIVERELREELIIVEPGRGLRYVFDWHDARLRDHPDYAAAETLWDERFRRQGFRDLTNTVLPLKWSLPPDADLDAAEQRHHDTIFIECDNEPATGTGQGFLNINAEDFGIEFDRIAKLSVGSEAVFCDGELRGGGLLNRPVGLFAVNRLQETLAAGARRFLPDRLFWDGLDRTGDDLEEVADRFLKRRGSSFAQLAEKLRAAGSAEGQPFDLCPVTRTIVERHRQLSGAEDPAASTAPSSCEVFVSFASEDRGLAAKVYDRIAASKRHAFFSDVSMTNGGFGRQIDLALDAATAFVAIGTRPEHLYKSWVEYEWRNFHNDLNSGAKPENAPFFAFITSMDPQDLPRPLRLRQAVVADPADPAQALERMARLLE